MSASPRGPGDSSYGPLTAVTVPVVACNYAVFTATVFAQDKNTLVWSPSSSNKMAKGPLSGVSSYITSATAVNGSGGLSSGALDITGDNPASGTGLYYIIRKTGNAGPMLCGSWQTVIGAEPGRDLSLP